MIILNDNIKIIKNYYDSLSIYPKICNKNVRFILNVNHQLNDFFNIDLGQEKLYR